ncbi:hypothetical protein ACYSNM_03550 [Myroides sp. LJL116]
MKLPEHWYLFIAAYQGYTSQEDVRVFTTEGAVIERYNTYEFATYLPNYIPIADDSGTQVAVIAKDQKDPKVYLSSYGTLIEADLKVLALSLHQWMQDQFVFEDKANQKEQEEAQAKLYITDIGPNRMKVVKLLKARFQLSGPEALAMCNAERILFNQSYLSYIQEDAAVLQSLEVSVEIVSNLNEV